MLLTRLLNHTKGLDNTGSAGLETGLNGLILNLAYGVVTDFLTEVNTPNRMYSGSFIGTPYEKLQLIAADLVYNKGYDKTPELYSTKPFLKELENCIANATNSQELFPNTTLTEMKKEFYQLIPELHELELNK